MHPDTLTHLQRLEAQLCFDRAEAPRAPGIAELLGLPQ